MRKLAHFVLTLGLATLLLSLTWGQTQPPAADNPHDLAMPGMNHDAADADSGVDMGPHMKMSHVRDLESGDEAKAEQVLAAARAAATKYADYKTALQDGYKIFLPNLPQKMYHFTNYTYGFEAAFVFNPEHPTSLLYEKHGDDYKLVGVMYTAPKNATEDELDERIPLSIAQWHAHVNLCRPPKDHARSDVFGPKARFGLGGSISTPEACEAAGGTWIPQVFGWMVHVYPFEKTAEGIWAVDRGHQHHGE
jgi:hypothetical protein